MSCDFGSDNQKSPKSSHFLTKPRAYLGSTANWEERSQATSFHVLFQVNCSALRSSPRTDSTRCLLTLSSTRSHAHKTVQCLPFTPSLHAAISLLSVTLPLALAIRAFFIVVSRIEYRCLSVQCVPLRLPHLHRPTAVPVSPPLCRTVEGILIVLSPLCTPALYPRTVLSTLCTLDPLHSRLYVLSTPCTLVSLHSRLPVLSTLYTLALYSRVALSILCTVLSSLYNRGTLSPALHFRIALSHCTLDSLHSRLFVLSTLCTLVSASRTALSTL